MQRPRGGNGPVPQTEVPVADKKRHHDLAINKFLGTHLDRNHTLETLDNDRCYITGFFRNRTVENGNRPNGLRIVFIWDLMNPRFSQSIVDQYKDELTEADCTAGTRRKKFGCLRRLCEYVLARPYILGPDEPSIFELYGPLDQPITLYDYPRHVRDEPKPGLVLTLCQLLDLYRFMFDYTARHPEDREAARDVAMIVAAAELGARANELRTLDAFGENCSLLFGKKRVILIGKGFRGSGPIRREALLTPYAEAVLGRYILHVRKKFPNAETNPALFLSQYGFRISYSAMTSEFPTPR
jgi:site-specific recombinase XerD